MLLSLVGVNFFIALVVVDVEVFCFFLDRETLTWTTLEVSASWASSGKASSDLFTATPAISPELGYALSVFVGLNISSILTFGG